MTKDQFFNVDVGDVLLAANGRHMHITAVSTVTNTLTFYWEADIANPGDPAGSDTGTYDYFAYVSHISKGTNYGTHRTLRHKADFKTKP